MLKQCESCDGYVDVDGGWVERREGGIRYADAMARQAPKTVAELCATLRQRTPELSREELTADLKELCRRHRAHHREALSKPIPWLTSTPIAGEQASYRDAGRKGGVAFTIGPPDTLKRFIPMPFGGALVAAALGFLLPSSLVGIAALAAGVLFMLGLLIAIVRADQRWRTPRAHLERDDETGTLRVRELGERLPLHRVWIQLRKSDDGQGQTVYRAYLRGGERELRLFQETSAARARDHVARLEYALGLSAPPPI